MKAQSTIRKELQWLRRHLRRAASVSAEAYGAMQALAWVLDDDAAGPRVFAPLGRPASDEEM
jgi:phage gp46-like protein